MSDDGGTAPQSGAAGAPSPRDLVRWSETLAAIARTGLGFTENLYERERFEEVLHVAADIKMAADELLDPAATPAEHDRHVHDWLESVGVGVPGYVTPKVAIGAIVGNASGELLLVQALRSLKANPDEIGDAHWAQLDRKSTRLNSSHLKLSRMPSSA